MSHQIPTASDVPAEPQRSWVYKPVHAGYWWRAARQGPGVYVTTLEFVTINRMNRDELQCKGQAILADPAIVWSPVNVPKPAETDFAVR